jgi:hypothetical protein
MAISISGIGPERGIVGMKHKDVANAKGELPSGLIFSKMLSNETLSKLYLTQMKRPIDISETPTQFVNAISLR